MHPLAEISENWGGLGRKVEVAVGEEKGRGWNLKVAND